MIGTHPISLDCLSLTSATVEALIRAAGSAGFDLVSLWLNPQGPFPDQILQPGQAQACSRLLAECGIGVRQIEAFDLLPPERIEAWRPQLALGAALGAQSVLFYNGSGEDRASAVAALRAACRIAGDYGLSVNLEPVSFSRLRTVREARELIEDAEVDAGIVLDFLHFVRAGSRLEDLDAIDARYLAYVQVCDGTLPAPEDIRSEAMAHRLAPGEGAFPIQDLLGLIPKDVVVGIEAPRLSRMTDREAPVGHARHLMDALLKFRL